MLFSTKLSKFGKGKNISAIMNSKEKINIYFFENGISKKEVFIEKNNLTLKRCNTALAYNEVIPINETTLVTRINKSIGIIHYE